MRTTRLLFVLLMSFFALPSVAQTSRDYAVMAHSTWAAFACSALASQMKDTKEKERLFRYGYKAGLTFVDAWRSGKVQLTDLTAEGHYVLLLLEGPTPDFMLGRIYAAAEKSALATVSDPKFAQSEYRDRNCVLIGTGK